MNHLLYHRFQGIALGSLVAESLAGYDRKLDHAGELRSQLWQTLAQEGHRIRFNNKTANFNFSALSEPDLLRATLPLAVFFHDEPREWVQFLDLEPEKSIALSIWAQIVAGLLTDRFPWDDQGDLTQIKWQFDPTAQKQFNPYLNQLQESLQEGLSTTRVLARLIPDRQAPRLEQIIALVLFYLLDSADSFRLAVLRSIHHADDPSWVSLTGALLGARLGVGSIPWAWRNRGDFRPSLVPVKEEMESVWWQWLGYNGTNSAPSSTDTFAIASAATLQPRSGSSLISQER